MVIILKRRIMNEILTTYLPTFLILTMVYATNFFKPFFFESVISVNLTALLVLTTLFISVSGGLPPTAYVKMVDIWLIFSLSIPFLEVLLHMNYYRDETDSGTTIDVVFEKGNASKVSGSIDNISPDESQLMLAIIGMH